MKCSRGQLLAELGSSRGPGRSSHAAVDGVRRLDSTTPHHTKATFGLSSVRDMPKRLIDTQYSATLIAVHNYDDASCASCQWRDPTSDCCISDSASSGIHARSSRHTAVTSNVQIYRPSDHQDLWSETRHSSLLSSGIHPLLLTALISLQLAHHAGPCL